MVSMLAKGEVANEIVRQHGASKDSPDLPTAHGSDLTTPNNVSDVEKSPGIQWSFTGTYPRAGAGLAISRERDRR